MKTNIKITLNTKEVKTAIKEYLNKRGWKTGQVEFLTGIRTGGTPYDETQESYFEGTQVAVNRKKS